MGRQQRFIPGSDRERVARIDAQAKGKRAERHVAAYLVDQGWTTARRHVRTGTSQVSDEGDLRLDGITFEVKHYRGGLTEQQIVGFLDKLNRHQKRKGDIGILIERRDQIAPEHAGRWWAHLWLGDLARLAVVGGRLMWGDPAAPVRLTLQAAVRLLAESGYRPESGNPFSAQETGS